MSRLSSEVAAERSAQVARMTRNGMSAQKIATRLGVSSRTVVRWRARMDVHPAVPDPGTIEARRESVARSYAGGSTISELAYREDVSRPTIRADLKATGTPSRRRGRNGLGTNARGWGNF